MLQVECHMRWHHMAIKHTLWSWSNSKQIHHNQYPCTCNYCLLILLHYLVTDLPNLDFFTKCGIFNFHLCLHLHIFTFNHCITSFNLHLRLQLCNFSFNYCTTSFSFLNQTYMPFLQTSYHPLSIWTHCRINLFPKSTCPIYLQNSKKVHTNNMNPSS